MATIKYSISGNNELANIYIRLRNGRTTDIKIPTGYVIDPKFWSVKLGKVKDTAINSDKINSDFKLEKMKLFIFDKLNEEKNHEDIEINKDWLYEKIKEFLNPNLYVKNDFFVDLVKEYQNAMKVKINPKTNRLTAPTTIRNFNTTIMRLGKFETHTNKKLRIGDINLKFHFEFIEYERNVLELSQNSISKDIKQIKTICIDAKDRGYKINEQVLTKKFNAPIEPTLFVTITEEEIKRIKLFKGSDYLENARDWLIIGCWTGCRVNDLMKLTTSNILKTTNGREFIRYVQSKTNKQVDIPIHQDIKDILNRLGNFPRPISDQRFNEWIKVVCKDEKVKINDLVHGSKQNKETHKKEVGTFEKWELIRSHTCRRSFATNHYHKLSNKVIMAVTGHATEKMLLNYIGETENEHIEDFINAWDKSLTKSENT
jgi:integrase